MSVINAKATNINNNSLYMCIWQYNPKPQRERERVFNITIMKKNISSLISTLEIQ